MGQPTKAAAVITGVVLALGMACAEGSKRTDDPDSAAAASALTEPARTFYVMLSDSATGNPMPRAGIQMTCTDDAGKMIPCAFNSAMPAAGAAAATADSGVGNPVP